MNLISLKYQIKKKKMIKRKLKFCHFCEEEKIIFKNVEGKKQCYDCYKKYKKPKLKMVLKKINLVDDGIKRANLIKLVDGFFSKLIKLKYNQNGYIACYTCDKIYPKQDIQCGHFIPRGNFSLRWSYENCRPQCKHCNEDLGGNLKEFKARLEAETPGITEELEVKKNLVQKYTMAELEEIKEKIKKEIKKFR